ncbi:MAG: ATP-dependent Clp protease ATP-binding subunit ClpA [Dissulfurimicrobium sp.]|uniref:ATP-dependent Clp protease ATP-binding subunit ClpA n=1 Tax=Dissulfurimicrobium sp. TaxID=2022436 RepID=UPI00404904AB
MISKDIDLILNLANREARIRGHKFLSLEHLLFAILTHEAGARIIKACGGETNRIKSRVEKFFNTHIEKTEGCNEPPRPTLALQRVLQITIMHCQSAGKTQAEIGDLLAAIMTEHESYAVYFLKQEGISRLDILNYISHGISKTGSGEMRYPLGGPCPLSGQTDASEGQKNTLETFTLNLIKKAATGGIDPLIGRKRELERTMQVLCRRRKNNPVFVGEPGVGKTAIVEGLALNIWKKNVPPPLAETQIFALDLGALLAGTKYRGEFEARLKDVIAQLQQIPGAILFIDEIHTLVGAGATSGGSMDAANILKPALASGELRCIGATTYEEYRNFFEKDRAISRRFQKIEIKEPDISESIEIIRGLKPNYERYHGVRYTNEALKTAVELSARYLTERYLPDKAIDVIDEAAAALRLTSHSGNGPRLVTARHIEAIIAKMAQIPTKSISRTSRINLAGFESSLKSVIFGQDNAIELISKAIRRAYAGLSHPDHPIGSFLFVGPTGVGKTELARQIASLLHISFQRLDMSEYMEKHAVARLIGAPPGYVGFDQGGLLTESIRRNPHCVLLLDEIEKAHPDVFNIFLQIMDHATLTDNTGRKTNFRNTIIIMTSNAGAREMEGRAIGFGHCLEDTAYKGAEAVKQTFSPEFRNRLDAIIQFNPLTPEIMVLVVDKMLKEIEVQLAAKKIGLKVSKEARLWLAEHGYDAKYGARPLGRLIQQTIKDQIADAILSGSVRKGGLIAIGLKDDRIVIV